MSIWVTLSVEEMEEAKVVGLDRSRRSAHLKPRFPYEKYGSDDQHILGARGELAFCRAIGVPWPKRVDTFRSLPDVDPWWEVRTSPERRRVKVATDDPPDYRVAHVVAGHGSRRYEIVGFVRAGWVFDLFLPIDPGNRNRPAYFVPVESLAPIESWKP